MALQGFDKDYYLSAKLAQLQADYTEWATKDEAFLETFLTNQGFTAESHYTAYGWAEGLAPNAYFDQELYVEAKAQQMFNSGAYISLEAARADFAAKWPLDPYLHYLQYGAYENVNPSNSFDESSYYDAKLAALQADPDTAEEWAGKDVADLQAVFQAAGFTALTHFLAYGMDEGLVAIPVPEDEQVVPPSETVPGETFMLTLGLDNVTGTSGNDIIKGVINEYDVAYGDNSTFDIYGGDVIDGGAGYDILDISQRYEDDDLYFSQVTNVEELRYQTLDEDELYMEGFSDIEKITLYRSDETGNDFYDVQNTVDVEFENNATSTTVDLNIEVVDAAAEADTEVTVTVTDNNDSVAELYMTNVTGDNFVTVYDVVANGNNTNAELDLYDTEATVTVNVSGNSDELDLTIDDTDELTTVNASAFGGDLTLSALTAVQDITVTGGSGDDSLDVTARVSTGASDEAMTTVSGGAGDDSVTVTSAAGLQTLAANGGDGDDTIIVNASSATVNGSTATINGGAGDDSVTYTSDANVAASMDLGAGDDSLTIDATYAAVTDTRDADAIDGGADTDTLRGTSANIAAIEADSDKLATISNFEQLAITDVMANDVDLTAWGFNRLTLEDGLASAGTVTMASGDTFEIADDSATTGTIVLDVAGASGAGANSDVVNIEVNADFIGAASVDMADVSIAYVETVNLTVADSDADTAGTGTITLTIADGDRIQTINVTSDQVTLVEDDGVTDLTAINVFNAAGSTGDVTFDGSAGTQGLTATGGSGDDTLTGTDYADIINGGEGDDTLIGGLGADTINGGDGDDDITGGTGANTLTGGDGVDNFIFADGDSTSTSLTTITDFMAGADGDTLTFGVASTYEAISEANQTAIDADTTLAAALTQAATQLAANEVTAFTYGGSTYVLFEDGSNAGAYNATEDVVIKLSGVTVDDLVAGNFL